MPCSNCGADNRPGSKFCKQCGSELGRVCPKCAQPVDVDASFCSECGAALSGRPAAGWGQPSVAPAPIGDGAATAERRLVSVLFADLVGFTTLSEKRDAEEVRELLTRYFDTCRSVVSLYGGVVEKFIGDAVMAVWGAPVAHEDDSERAVRAALDLVEAVVVARSRDRGARAAGSGRRADRRRRGHPRRQRPGDGGRRPGQHGVADPGRGRAGDGAGR